ncbi:MAG: OmpH family outer membrane protein [Sphingomonadales bacterium]
MKLLHKILLLFAFGMPLLLSAPLDSFAQATASKIVVVNFTEVTNESFVGQDVQNQLKAYEEIITARKAELENQLNAEGQTLEGQESVLPPDAFQQRVTEFQNKARNAEIELQGKRALLVRAQQQAEQEITRNLRPIVLALMGERGADIVLDKALTYMVASGTFDISDEIVQRLNSTITSFALNLPNS